MGDEIQEAQPNNSGFGNGDELGTKKDEDDYLTIREQWQQVPFLRMLQEPTSFQLLLKLQEKRRKRPEEEEQKSRPSKPRPSLESCITHSWEKVDALAERRLKNRCCLLRPAESHRRSHIEVERNRRRLMNDHLSALRSLMPPSFLPRVDQATVVAGAIDYLRGLEEQVQRLEVEKQRIVGSQSDGGCREQHPFWSFFVSPRQHYHKSKAEDVDVHGGCMDVEARVVQSHAHVRVAAMRCEGQLVRAISAMWELHLEVLHLCVTTSQDYALYTLSLKVMEECKLTSAEEIASAVHQIFTCTSSMCVG